MENFEFRKNSKLRLIRNAKEKDINVLANLCAQLGYPAVPSDIAARLEKLRHNSKNHIFVAEIPFQTGENNTVAGFISFESYETIYCDAGINITGFVVDEKARKTGIGRSLMKAVEFYAERTDFHLYARSQVQHGKMRIKHTENSVLIPKRVRFAF